MFLHCNRALCVQYARTAILEIEFLKVMLSLLLRCGVAIFTVLLALLLKLLLDRPPGRKRDAFSPVFWCGNG